MRTRTQMPERPRRLTTLAARNEIMALLPNDQKAVARLVSRYGSESVIDAIQRLPAYPGRHPYEDASFAQWIEEYRDELKSQGMKRGTLKAALRLALEFRWGNDKHRQPTGNSGMELLKKMYQRGLPIYRHQLESAAQIRKLRGK